MSNNFHAVNAKIGVLKKGILNYEDYNRILSFEKREDIIKYLKENPIYKAETPKFGLDLLNHRYTLEFMLQKAETDILIKLKHFLFGQDKYLVDAMLTRYEFEDIKLILRSILDNVHIDLERETLLYGFSNHVDYDKLSKCENMYQALDILKTTIYKRAMVFLSDEDVSRLHFHVEMKLDALYFKSVRKAAEKMSKSTQKILENYYSSMIDTINMQWILRAKNYYNLSNEEIYNYTLRGGRYIKGEFMKNLVYSQTPREVIDKLTSSKLSKMLGSDTTGNTISIDDINAYVHDKQIKKLKCYNNNISTFLRFMIQILVQNENITRISEAIKYNLGKDEKKKYLIKAY